MGQMYRMRGKLPLNKAACNIWIALFVFSITIYASLLAPQAAAQDAGGYITEQEVYDHLDNHDLSLRYAKQEIKRGEMLNAGAALERMLYKNPNWHSARLLYSAVLYRLDDQKAALRELSLLDGKELNQDQEQTYTRYKTAFSIPPRPAFKGLGTPSPVYAGSLYASNGVYNAPDPVKASLTLSVRGDNNAGNALTDEGFGFENRGDVSAVIEGKLQANIPLSSDGKVAARFGVSGLMRRHDTFSQADYDVIDGRAGISVRPGNGVMSLDVDVRSINVSGEKYLNQIGPRATFSQPISETTRATVSLSFYDQDYKALSFASREDERDGIKTSLQVGLLKKIDPSQKVTMAFGFDTKSADLRAFAYSGPVAAVSYEKQFQKDITGKVQLRARQLNYKGSLTPLTSDREDLRLSARASFGTSLEAFIPTGTLNKSVLELGVNYNLRESNLDANNYDNLGADLRLTIGF